jgi:5-methyltetrahydrofolate--homocysteine methyltransferase
MSQMLTDYIEDVTARWDAWWDGTNTSPVVQVIYPVQGARFPQGVKPWMSRQVLPDRWTGYKHEFIFGQAVELADRTGQMHYVDDAITLFEHYADATGQAGEGFHFLFINLGASMMSAFLTGHTQFNGDTIWLETPEPMGWEQIEAIDENVQTHYAQVAMEAMRRLTDRLSGRFIFAMPELGGLLDILAAMRHTMNLLTDTLDCPERLQAGIEKMARMYRRFDKEMRRIVEPANGGRWTPALRYLSGVPGELGTCDFSAMIGPDAFEQFVMPWLREQCETYPGRVIFHLDGPGELPHVDLLLTLEGLHSIQWVCGAGNPPGLSEKWYPLYRKILDGGKRIALCGGGTDPEKLQAFFKVFPATEFTTSAFASSRSEAQRLVDALR